LASATYISPQIERITGYTAEEILAEPGLWRSLYHPDDRDRLAAESTRFQRHKRPTAFVLRLRRKDGRYIWIRDEAWYVRDSCGRTLCVQGVVRDITAQREEEEKRRREQRLLADSQRVARVGSWEMDFSTGRLEWTGETYRLFGVNARTTRPSLELAWRLVHPEDAAQVRRVLEAAVQERTPYRMVHRMQTVDGREIVVSVAGAISYDEAGRPQRLVGTVQDVTEWHSAHRERVALSQLVEHSSDMIAMATADGRITYMNRAGLRLTGAKRREVMDGLTLEEISEPSATHILRNTVLPTVMSQGHWEGEVLLRHRRTGKPVEGYGAVFLVRGEDGEAPQAIAAIIRDARERRRIEQEALTAADHEQHRIGMDLHDVLGQTLTGAAMLGATLERRLASRGSEEAAQAARLSRLLLEATNQTRELARGLCPVPETPEGLRLALGDLARSVQEVYGIECSVRAAQDALIEDHAVAGQVFFIAREAVNNAAKHAQARAVRMELRRTDHALELSVEDDGRGFAQDAHDKGGLGFRTMRYRAGVIGAQLSLEINSTGGATVRCRVPLQRLKPPRDRKEDDKA